VFEAKEAEIDRTIATAKRVMEKAALPAIQLKVPIQVDAKAAANWEEAH
jgi:DNA polymerase-1